MISFITYVFCVTFDFCSVTVRFSVQLLYVFCSYRTFSVQLPYIFCRVTVHFLYSYRTLLLTVAGNRGSKMATMSDTIVPGGGLALVPTGGVWQLLQEPPSPEGAALVRNDDASISLADGWVTNVVLAAVCGVALWLAVVTYLGRPQGLATTHRNSMLDILLDTVRRGEAQQDKQLHHPPTTAQGRPQQLHIPHAAAQGRPQQLHIPPAAAQGRPQQLRRPFQHQIQRHPQQNSQLLPEQHIFQYQQYQYSRPQHHQYQQDHRGPQHQQQQQDHRGPQHQQQQQDHRGPQHQQQQQDHRGPQHQQQQQDHRGPQHHQQQQDHRGPQHQQQQQDHRGPQHQQQQQDHRGPEHQQQQQDHRGPQHQQQQQDHRGPQHHQQQQDHRGPQHQQQQQDHRGPQHQQGIPHIEYSHVPLDHRPQHEYDDLTHDLSAIKTLGEVSGAQIHDPGRGRVEEGEEAIYKSRPSFPKPNNVSSSYNTFQTKPFSRPGNFVNTNEKGQGTDNVIYDFERPHRLKTLQNRPKRPNEDVINNFERPSNTTRTPGRRRRPITQPRNNVTSHVDFPAGYSHVPDARTSASNQSDGIISHKIHPSEVHRWPTTRLRPDIFPRNDSTYYFASPLDLLNPKPNTWMASGTNQTPSERHSTIWNQNKGTTNDQITPSDGDLYRTTLPPATAAPTLVARGAGRASSRIKKLSSSTPPGLPAIMHSQDLAGLRLEKGVPLKWIPDGTGNYRKRAEDAGVKQSSNTAGFFGSEA
ncbi:probable basic-leucine zipper transcription factor Q isoform X2 [Procambarus clarkii]|uniref:probable basic-leucine zipper transcription factor Q isoform X2 n=1 Tax=Procambarus clarkii TaxID=6728 RepID=UPI003741EA9D